jgi:xylulokinase
MADVFGAEVAITTSTEGPAFGAAILGGVAAGSFTSVEEGSDALVHVTKRIVPDAATAARYRDLHAIWRSLYPALRPSFERLSAIE